MVESLLIVVGATMLCMLSPGPDLVLVLRNTWTGGRGGGGATALGILTGNAVHMAYCGLGVGWLIVQSVLAYAVVKYLGAAYLIFLGIQGLRARPTGVSVEMAVRARASRRRPYLQGLVNNLLNPKGALFYLGIFTQVIDPATSPAQVVVLAVAIWSTSALFWVVFVSGVAAGPLRALLERGRIGIERAFGALMIALGVRVAMQD